jgi:hypothetical protein
LAGLGFFLSLALAGILVFGLFRGWGRHGVSSLGAGAGAEAGLAASATPESSAKKAVDPTEEDADSELEEAAPEEASNARPGESFSGYLDKTQRKLEWKETSLGLGVFSFDVRLPTSEPGRDDAGAARRAPIGMAQVEVYLQCDSKRTCDFLSERAVEVKSIVSGSLVGIERTELFAPEGKRRLKRLIMDRLNHSLDDWLDQGKVDDVFFSKLMVK